MRVLITGATGFLGSNLAQYMRGQGHDVACLHRKGTNLPAPITGLPSWTTDEDGTGFGKALNDFRPDTVVHLAALYLTEHRPEDVAPLLRANIEYGVHLLEAMREAESTAMVFAGTSWQHYRNQAYCPANLYAATKQAFTSLADYYRDAHGLRLLELHLYDSYGPNDPRKKLIHHLCNAARNATPLAMSHGEQRIHLLHVDDLTRALEEACVQVQAFPSGHRELYRLPSPTAISLRELVTLFNQAHPDQPVKVDWGKRPYREREIFEPWEGCEILPNWAPRITLAEGLATICR